MRKVSIFSSLFVSAACVSGVSRVLLTVRVIRSFLCESDLFYFYL